MSYAASEPWNDEPDPARLAARELDRQPPEPRRERDERPEQLEVLGADNGDVDGVRDEPALERRDDLLGDDQPGAILRLLGRGGEVRRDDDVLELEQLAGVRLGREDVERRAGDLPRANRRGKRLLVDELPARRVDNADARPHQLDGRRIDEAARLVREREVERQEVGGREHLLRACADARRRARGSARGATKGS